MTYEKQICFPKTATRKLCFNGCSLFRERENMLIANDSLHFRPEGEFLICGEGGEEIANAPAVSRLYGGKNGLLLYGGGTLYRYTDGKFLPLGSLAEPKGEAEFRSESGERKTYLISQDGVFCAEADAIRKIGGAAGGTCCAVHYERLFTANGCRVRYSRALSPEDWTESPQGAGFVDLPSKDGDVVAMIPYKEKLYLFRERGIAQLRALGDNLNFKAVTMPYACGKILPHSVINCGGKVLFLTESGLYAFNGGTCSRLKGSGAYLWGNFEDAFAACCGTRYYACIRTKDYGNRLFSYDCEAESGYFMRAKAEDVAAYGGVYYLAEEKLFRLTACGFPAGERYECVLKTELTSFGLSDGMKFLDGIALGGNGYFRIRAENERGEGSAVYGKAGERLRFPRPVRGNVFSLKISAYTESARLGSIAVTVREET